MNILLDVESGRDSVGSEHKRRARPVAFQTTIDRLNRRLETTEIAHGEPSYLHVIFFTRKYAVYLGFQNGNPNENARPSR